MNLLENLNDNIQAIKDAPATIQRHFTILYIGLTVTLVLTLYCLFRKK